MKFLVLAGALVSAVSFASPKELVICQKGNFKIMYEIDYKDIKGQPPCKVYEKYDGKKTRRIAYSERTLGVCEDVMTRVLAKTTAQGMTCDPWEETKQETKQEG